MSKDLQELAKNLYKEMFGEVLTIPVIFSNSLRGVYGRAYYRPTIKGYEPTRIDIAKNLQNRLDLLMFTLKHELIHIYLFEKYNDDTHGAKFRKYANKFKVYTRNPSTNRKSFTKLYASTLKKEG